MRPMFKKEQMSELAQIIRSYDIVWRMAHLKYIKQNPNMLFLPTKDGIDATIMTRLSKEAFNAFFNPTWVTELDNLAEKMMHISQACCTLIKAGQAHIHVQTKDGIDDFVTQVDKGIETIITRFIRLQFPTHKIIGEESVQETFTEKDWVWVIDPIDGTSNYIDGGENVAFHLTLLKGLEPQIAIIGFPFQDYLLMSTKNTQKIEKWENGKKVTFKPQVKLSPAAVSSECKPAPPEESRIFNTVKSHYGVVPDRYKSIGVSIVSALYGNLNAFYKVRAKLWDVIPPSALLYLDKSNPFTFHWIFSPGKDATNFENPNYFHAFENDPFLIDQINTQTQYETRVGLFIMTPKENPGISEFILKATRSEYTN